MKKKKIAIAVLALSLIGALVIGGTMAYFTDKAENSNVITLGKVDGRLVETDTSKNDGSKTETGNTYTNIKPGDVLTKDPTVSLKTGSSDAYVRVKISYTGLTADQIAELETGITLNKGWYYNSSDGYFYYNTILTVGDSSTVFNQVEIPGSWNNGMAEKQFTMDISAEFIQSDNFTPTKTTVSGIEYVNGWGTVTIEEYNK